MAKKGTERSAAPSDDNFLTRLREIEGTGGGLELDALDGRVVYCAVLACAHRGASFTLGVTQGRDSWVCQVWDGKFPDKRYFRDTGELNRHLAAITRAIRGNQVSADVEAVLREYGW